MEVMLRKTVGSNGHPQGGGGEVITHHRGRKGSKWPNRTIKFVLQWRIVLFFQRSAFLGSPVLEPNLDLKVRKYLKYIPAELSGDYTLHTTHLSLRQPDHVGQLGLPPDGDIAAVVELLLQLQSLVVAVHDPVLVFCSRPSWKLQKSLVWIRLEINHSFPSKISVAKHQDYISFVGGEV